MPHSFIGREHELKVLSGLLKKSTASLVVIKGRRRIGKSRLIEEFAKNHTKDYTFYKFSGIAPTDATTNQSQLNDFALQLSKQMRLPKISADNWYELFDVLYERIKTGKAIILFDEISWMGSKDPDFLGKFKNAWDMYFKTNNQLVFFLCGSVSSWIDKNILSSTGFVGRISLRMTLLELPLAECNLFWKSNAYISAYEKLKILSVTGGVPRYLEEVDPSLPADENIRKLCFTKEGLLVHEFNDIFSDLFSKRNETYKKIVETLENGPREAEEIINSLGRTYTGTTIEYLEDLVTAGFLSRDYTWLLSSGKLSKLSHFRLSDNYSRFYLKYINPVIPKINRDAYQDISITSLPGWDTIMGYQCENLILNNRKFIIDRIGIKSIDIVTDNPFFQRKTKKIPGCQIDYLIQTKFGGLFLCEFKFSRNPVGIHVIDEVQKKIERMVYPKGFSIWPVLIHVNGVEDEVRASNFFSHIIDLGELLTPSKTQAKRQK
jgi:AAA+ ATPase superfamily predicted ATPase